MQHRTGRALIVLLGLSAVALAACAPVAPPPPPPPPDVICPGNATPSQNEQAALVDPAHGDPTVVTFQASTQAAVDQHVKQLENQGDNVISVEPDRPVSALTPPNVDPTDDTDYSQQWGFTANVMNFSAAWNTKLLDGDPGVVPPGPVRVAVIDTGVQGTHPDLSTNVMQGKDFVSSDSASNFARIDGNGHGTHVAGIIAAQDNQVGVVGGAPHAQIVPVRVLDCQGSGSYSAVANGILWASDTIANGGGGVQVINLSLGGSSPSSTLQNAVDMAISRGVVVVAAAGNCGQVNNCGTSGDGVANEPSYPGALSGVLAVGAIDQAAAAPFAKAAYSNNNTYIGVAAPGTNVHSTYVNSTYANLSGTSMATPHVSALAALIKEECGPGYSVATLVSHIVSSAGNGPISGFAGSVGLAKPDAATALAC